MDFYAVLDQVLASLRQRGRVSYRALKRQFDLDDAYLDDLKVEILEVHQCAVDQEGTMLVWTGEAASAVTSEPVEVFELVGASDLRRRLQASAARGLTRFVGRQQELMALQLALERAGMGQGQMAALIGEAGLGKSRLVYEFVHSHHTPGWSVLESASVSYGTAMPYFPVIDLLRRYGHIADQDDPRTIRAKVTGQVFTLDETLQDALPALLSLLDALPEDSPFLTLDPPQRRQRTLQAIVELPEVALHGGLTHLQAAEFLYETRLFPEREYTFTHALTHEVAYSGLLQERRRALHAQIVAALETLANDRGNEQVDLLAQHAIRGQVWDKVLTYCRQAGEKAMARSAYREALGYFEQAIDQCPRTRPYPQATRF